MINLTEYDLTTPAELARAAAAAIDAWHGDQLRAVQARGLADRERAVAIANSTAKNADGREADALLQAGHLLHAASTAECDARAARFQVEFLVGLAGGRTVIER